MPASAFAEHFRAHAGPRLRVACRLHGMRVACGDEDYSCAYDLVLRQANALVGWRLPDPLWDDLCHAVHEWLTARIEEIGPQWTESQGRADRVAIDVAAYFADWRAAQLPRFEPWP